MDDNGDINDSMVVNITDMVDKQSDELEILREIPANTKKKRKRVSTYMDDGGESNDLMAVNSNETFDKQFDGLEILMEIPANSMKKRKSTFMDDGGVSDDLVVVNCIETADKQSDELEILKEIPANAKKKRQGKKRWKSTLMDDGGVYDDYMVVNSIEMVDKQSDELEILREIPANAKKKRQGKKLQYKSERAGQRCCDPSSSSSIGLTPPPRLMQCGNRNWLSGHDKRNKMLVGEGSPCNRRWEDMDHEILIHIFKRYPWHTWCFRYFFICKSWISAFLDYLFPPGQVLDLRFLDGTEFLVSNLPFKRFYQFLILNLNRLSPDSYTEIILPEFFLRPGAYELIARRLPLLKSFVSPEKLIPLFNRRGFPIRTKKDDYEYYGCIVWSMCPLMQNLERVHCHIKMLVTFAGYCKLIRSLTVIGRIGGRWVGDQLALQIAQGFPLLEHLSISGYIFSVNGLSMILDCHMNLQYIDLQHTVCMPGRAALFSLESPWPEEISKRLASVKTLLTCPGKNCKSCSLFYKKSL